MSDETSQPNPEPIPTATENQNPEAEVISESPTELAAEDGIPANEPSVSSDPTNPNITIEKNGNDITITEVMEPTAQMAGNEGVN